MMRYLKHQKNTTGGGGGGGGGGPSIANVMLASVEFHTASAGVNSTAPDGTTGEGSAAASQSPFSVSPTRMLSSAERLSDTADMSDGMLSSGSSQSSGTSGSDMMTSGSDMMMSNDSVGSAGSRSRQMDRRRRRTARQQDRAIARAEDEQKQRRYLQRWGTPPTLIMSAINARHAVVQRAERVVTATLRRVAKTREHKALLKGMDNRLKSKSSLTRKVLEKTDGGAGMAPQEIEEAIRGVHDVLRYTMVISTKRYTGAVLRIMAALEALGYGTVKCKNYWVKEGEATDYMGINAVFRTPDTPQLQDSVSFELQFHTMQSLDTKMQRCHHSYAKFRESVRRPLRPFRRPF
jgi:hypothetical protein